MQVSPARRTARLAAALLAAAPAALRAQLPNPLASPGPRLGVMAGLSSATFGGNDASADAALGGTDKKRRNGVVAGVYATTPLLAGLSLRGEALYAQKGVRYGSSDGEAKIKLDYLEIPVLAQLDVPGAAPLRPAIYAGPSFAFRLRCQIDVSQAGGGSFNSDCTNQALDLDVRSKAFDVSGVVGGQVNFTLAGLGAGVGARYTHGFTKVVDNADVKNRAFAIYGAVEIGR